MCTRSKYTNMFMSVTTLIIDHFSFHKKLGIKSPSAIEPAPKPTPKPAAKPESHSQAADGTHSVCAQLCVQVFICIATEIYMCTTML